MPCGMNGFRLLWQAVRSGMDWKTAWANVYTNARNVHRRIWRFARLALWPCFGTGMRGCACFNIMACSPPLPVLPGRQARMENLPARLMPATTWSEPGRFFGSFAQRLDKRLPQRLWAWR